MTSDLLEQIDLRIVGAAGETAVDAEVLAAVLLGLQRAVHAVAMDTRNEDPSSQSYVPRTIEKHFPVRCLVAKPGSYAMSILIGNPDDLVSPLAVKEVVGAMCDCLNALFNEITEPFYKIKNPRYRVRILDAFRTMLPKAGSSWKLGIARPQYKELLLSGDDARKVTVMKERLRSQEIVAQTITGYLQAMDFDSRRVTIVYPETSRELECVYDSEWEPELIAARRGLVQVTGTVVLDASDHPLRITAVENIQPLDLSDFEVNEVSWGDTHIILREPLVLTPELTESKQHLVLHDDNWHIHVIAPTRDELLVELHEQIAVLWSEYGLEDEGKLAKSACTLRERMRAAIREGDTIGKPR